MEEVEYTRLGDGESLKRLLSEKMRLRQMLRTVDERIAAICKRCDHTWTRVRADSLYSESYLVCTKCDARK